MKNRELVNLERDFGIHFPPSVVDYLDPRTMTVGSGAYAMDAQPGLITASNAGIPAWLTNYVDPELVRILASPMKAVQIMGGEQKKGNWTTLTTTFQKVEPTGEVSSYGDWNNNGSSGVNTSFEYRQSYTYQTILQWGEREMDMAAENRINYAAELSNASAMQLNKFQNLTYFFGIAGLANYGLLNDPSLPAAITPAATGTGSGTTWSTKTGDLVYADILALYAQLVSQTAGMVDQSTPIVLAMSPSAEVNLMKTNMYNVNVSDLLKKNLPNLRIETAVEYATAGGQLVQMIVPEMDGMKTAVPAFTEKLRAHPVVTDVSSFKQKRSQGTWGTVIRRPFLIAQMLGV
jgi:hypothetical protein